MLKPHFSAPRTKQVFSELNIDHERLHVVSSLSYLEFNYLVERAKVVITDSGGVTEETTMFYTGLFVVGGTVLLTILGTLDSYIYSNLTLGIGLALGLYVMDYRQKLN